MAKSATSKLCFFLIDDNYADLQIFDTALEQIYPNSSRKCFEGGEELISFLENPVNQGLSPSAIFVDLNMPGMNGKEVLTYINSDKRINSPIYMLSGAIHAELTRELIAMGAKDVFEKPGDYYEIVELFSKIPVTELILK